MRLLLPRVLLFAALQNTATSFVLLKNQQQLQFISSRRWQPLAAESFNDAVQDAFAYFSQLPPEQIHNDLLQRGEWYELVPFPPDVLTTPKTIVDDCSPRVVIQTGLYQDSNSWVVYQFQGETETPVLRGLIQILADITQDVSISDVMNVSPYDITQVLGLKSALSQSDCNEISAVWNALQQQIQNSISVSENEPSTAGTSIPGAGSEKPSVKKGWSPGSSNSQSGQPTILSENTPPLSSWDPSGASSLSSAVPTPPPSSSDRLSRLDRLSSTSTTSAPTLFADGAKVDESASKAPWDNWVPPPKAETASSISQEEQPSAMGTSIPGASNSKPTVKKGWGPGTNSGGNNQSTSAGSAPPFAIWDPTSSVTESSASPTPPSSSSSSDRLSRLDRLSSTSASAAPTFADGAKVDASASQAPWDNWAPPPKKKDMKSVSQDEQSSTMGTSIPGAASSKPMVKKGWGPGASSGGSNQSTSAVTPPPFAIWDPTSASPESSASPTPPPPSSSSDRQSRLDRLASTSTAATPFADGAKVDASAGQAPWDNWAPPPKKEDKKSTQKGDQPSTMGTSIPGAASSKPMVKKGWGPGSSSGGSSQSTSVGTSPPFAVWDPTSASSENSVTSTPPPPPTSSDRMSRLERLSSTPTAATTFAEASTLAPSASQAPWDNWAPPPKKEVKKSIPQEEQPSTMGTSMPGAASSKPMMKKGWGPGASASGNSQSTFTGTAPPFAIWDPTSASTESSAAPSPPPSSSSDRMSRLERLSSTSATAPTFADGAIVDASASQAPWDNWTTTSQLKADSDKDPTFLEGSVSMGTSIPERGSGNPPVEKGWGPDAISGGNSRRMTATVSAPPFTTSDPSGLPSQRTTDLSSSSSQFDRLSRLDRLSPPSAPSLKRSDGAEVDSSVTKAPRNDSKQSQKAEISSSYTATQEHQSSRKDSVPSSQQAPSQTAHSSSTDVYSKFVNPSQSTSPLGPVSIASPKSPWKADPSPMDRNAVASSERPPWEIGSVQSPQSLINSLSGKAPDQQWHRTPIQNDILQPQEVTSSSLYKSNSGPSDTFVQNSKKVYDSIPKSDTFSASSLGPDFIESDRYKTKVPTDASRSAPSNPWRESPSTKASVGAKVSQSNSNSRIASNSRKMSDGIDPLPFTPKNLQSPGTTSFGPRTPGSPSGVGYKSTASSTPWTGSTPSTTGSAPWAGSKASAEGSAPWTGSTSSTAGSTRVSLQPHYSASTTMSSWTGSTPSKGSPTSPFNDRTPPSAQASKSSWIGSTPSKAPSPSPFNERTPRGAQADRESRNPASPTFPTKLGDFTSEGNRKPKTVDSQVNARDMQSSGSREREIFRSRPEPVVGKSTQTNSSLFDADILKDTRSERQPRSAGDDGRSGTKLPPDNQYKPGFSSVSSESSFGRDTGQTASKWSKSNPSRGPEKDPNAGDSAANVDKRSKSAYPGIRPRTYLDIVTGNYERAAGKESSNPSSFRGVSPGSVPKSTTRTMPRKDASPFNSDPRIPSTMRDSFRDASQGPLDPNAMGYEARRPPFNNDVPRSASETYRSPPLRPDQKPPLNSNDMEYEARRPPFNNDVPRSASESYRSPPPRPDQKPPLNPNAMGYEARRPPFNNDVPRPASESYRSPPLRPDQKPPLNSNDMGYEARRPPFNNDVPRPASESYSSPPLRPDQKPPLDSNDMGYDARRALYNNDVPRPASESYRSPPVRPDQKPYVDRIIPTRPYGSEGPLYPPFDALRVNVNAWQQREGPLPPPGPPEYFDYRGEGPMRPGDERFEYRGNNAWRPPGPGPRPGNGPYGGGPWRPPDIVPR